MKVSSLAGNKRKLKVTASTNMTLTMQQVPQHCRRARTLLLGPLAPQDLDAASFINFKQGVLAQPNQNNMFIRCETSLAGPVMFDDAICLQPDCMSPMCSFIKTLKVHCWHCRPVGQANRLQAGGGAHGTGAAAGR